MEAKIKFKGRHETANILLKETATPKIEKYSLRDSTQAVAVMLDISPQTVVNYIYGRGKDGFLTEALTKAFKTLKLPINK